MAPVWRRQLTTVQAGEYSASNVTVSQLVSSDGRFTITRCGSVTRRRENGIYGQLLRKFRWSGYRLVDASPKPWESSSKRYSTVTQAKREAARRTK